MILIEIQERLKQQVRAAALELFGVELEQLSSESFIMRENKSGALRTLDHARDRERLSTAGNAEQHLILGAISESPHKGIDGSRLVTLRFIL